MVKSGNWGARLRAFRARMNLKQEAAAEELGVSQAYISRLEVGSLDPSPEIVQRLESLLRTPEHRAYFDHWRAAIRHCQGCASLIRQHDGHICMVEISRGMRALGEPFAGFVPGDRLDEALGPQIETWLEALCESGVLQGRVGRVEDVWSLPASGQTHYFTSVSMPVRDDLGEWYVFSCHGPIDRETYHERLRAPEHPLVVAHEETSRPSNHP